MGLYNEKNMSMALQLIQFKKWLMTENIANLQDNKNVYLKIS